MLKVHVDLLCTAYNFLLWVVLHIRNIEASHITLLGELVPFRTPTRFLLKIKRLYSELRRLMKVNNKQ